MSDYIKREDVLELGYWHGEHPTIDNPFPSGVDAVDTNDIEAIPAADVRPVKEGYWIENCTDYICSACGGVVSDEIVYMLQSKDLPDYCPYCGVKLKGVQP